MNSTKWESLSSFVQYLGKMGLCKVDHNEEGFWVQYIDRDPRVLARQEELQKQATTSLDAEERSSAMIAKQVALAQKAEREARRERGEDVDADREMQPTEMKERSEEEKVVFSLGGGGAPANSLASTAAAASSIAASSPAAASPSGAASSILPPPVPVAPKPIMMALKPAGAFNAFAAAAAAKSSTTAPSADESMTNPLKRKQGTPMSALDALMVENERLKRAEGAKEAFHQAKKQKLEDDAAAAAAAAGKTPAAAPAAAAAVGGKVDYWLYPNLIVKLLNKKLLGGRLYKQKGVVLRVIDRYVAELRVQSSSEPSVDQTVLQIDQDELETVIPAIGKVVRIVNGPMRGEVAVLLELNEAKYQAKVRIESGVLRGKEVDGLDYEWICKMNEA